jgi:hypothetical protein
MKPEEANMEFCWQAWLSAKKQFKGQFFAYAYGHAKSKTVIMDFYSMYCMGGEL